MQPTQKTKLFAVVTGASCGIGYELAKQFAEHGYDLLVAAEDAGIVEVPQAFSSYGIQVEPIQVDLATREGVEALYRRIQTVARPVDAIAVNAGVGVGGDFARQTDIEAELNLINLNVTSSVYLTKLVLKDMIARNQGKILITASIASVLPAPFEAVYGASKAFLLSFSEALHNELKDTEICVTALMPGPTETNFFHRAGMDDTKVGVSAKDDPAQVARQGFEALMANKDHVVAGSFKNKIQAGMAKIMTETAKAQVHRGMAEPGSGQKE